MFTHSASRGRRALAGAAIAAASLAALGMASGAAAAAWTGPGAGTTSQLEPGLDVVAIANAANPLDRTTPANLVVNGDFTDNGFGNTTPKKWGAASTNSLSGLGWISAISPGVAGATGAGTDGLPYRTMPGWRFTGGGTNTYALWLPGTSGAVGPWGNGLTQWGPYGSKGGASSPQIYFGNDEGWNITPSMASLRSTNAFTEDVTQTPLTFGFGTPVTTARNYVSSAAPTAFQDVPTTVGDTYCMSYWVGHESYGGTGSDARAGIARLRIGTSTGPSGDGYSSVYFKVPTLLGALGERWYTFQFVAKASSTRIAFTSWGHLGNGSSGSTELVLDDVVVNHCAVGSAQPPANPSVGVGDTVWVDANANGVQDGAEVGLAGVQVQLVRPDGTIADDENGNPVAAVTTDAQGEYFIGGLAPGNYRAQFTLPSGYVFTEAGAAAGTSATDSNPSPSTSAQVGMTPTFAVGGTASGDTVAVSRTGASLANLTIDAGVVQPVGMGNYAWIDADADGIQDIGELPLAGVVVELLEADGDPAIDAAGNPVTSVTTDAQGAYFIGNLRPGSYTARFTIPSGYSFTIPAAGAAGVDSNAVASANSLVGVTPVFTIASGVSGDTTSLVGNSTAAFANLTIAAGVVPLPTPVAAPAPVPTTGTDPVPADPGSGAQATPAGAAVTTTSPPRRVVTAVVLQTSVGSMAPASSGGSTTLAVAIANPTDAVAAGVTSSIVIPDDVVVESVAGGRVVAGRVVWPARAIPPHGRVVNTATLRAVRGRRVARFVVAVSAGGRRVVMERHLRVVAAVRSGARAVTG